MRWAILLALFASHPAAAQRLSGVIVNVIDGETLVVKSPADDRFTVTLAGVDAPERQQPYWRESRQSLMSICLGKDAAVEWSALDHNRKRGIGHVSCAGKDAAGEQVKRGMVWASPRATQPTATYYELEGVARMRGIGLWRGDEPLAPWTTRK